MRALFSLVVAAACGACGSDESHPPEFSPDANLAKPRTCAEVRQGAVQSGAVWVDDAPAACGPSAQECPIFDLSAFSSVCKQGVPYATCKDGKWVVNCNPDAGVPDAAND